jgi:hypothetical protein
MIIMNNQRVAYETYNANELVKFLLGYLPNVRIEVEQHEYISDNFEAVPHYTVIEDYSVDEIEEINKITYVE